jgi:hypothetical protein
MLSIESKPISLSSTIFIIEIAAHIKYYGEYGWAIKKSNNYRLSTLFKTSVRQTKSIGFTTALNGY